MVTALKYEMSCHFPEICLKFLGKNLVIGEDYLLEKDPEKVAYFVELETHINKIKKCAEFFLKSELRTPDELYFKLIEIFPNFKVAFDNIILFFSENKDTEKFKEFISYSVKDTPDQESMHFLLSSLEDIQKMFDQINDLYIFLERTPYAKKHLGLEFNSLELNTAWLSFFFVCYILLDSAHDKIKLNMMADGIKEMLKNCNSVLNAAFFKVELFKDDLIKKSFAKNEAMLFKLPEIEWHEYRGQQLLGLKHYKAIHEFGKTKKEAEVKFWVRLAELFSCLKQASQENRLSDSMKRKYEFLSDYLICTGKTKKEYKEIFPKEVLADKPKWKGRPVLTEDDLKKIKCPFPPENYS